MPPRSAHVCRMSESNIHRPKADRHWRRRVRRAGYTLLSLLAAYLLAAYVILPLGWTHFEHHPAMEGAPKVAVTREGISGDPLNVGLIGTKQEVVRAMLTAGWQPADRTTLRTSMHLAAAVVFNHVYETAPVSNLYVWGKREDLAFERPVDGKARQRHHVRFWKANDLGTQQRPLWIGAATFDRGVGVSHYTGKVTHHIKADIDAERDRLFEDLSAARQLDKIFEVTGVGPTLLGRNGGGDRYFTDGEVKVGLVSTDNIPQSSRPDKLENPPLVELKNEAWDKLRPLLQ